MLDCADKLEAMLSHLQFGINIWSNLFFCLLLIDAYLVHGMSLTFAIFFGYIFSATCGMLGSLTAHQ